MPENKLRKHVLPVIVFAQFAGTSLWFVGNAVLPELRQSLGLSQYALSYVTSAVMLGFITGTLCFGIFSLADRFSPVKLFFLSSVLGALANVAVAWVAKDAASLFALRFCTGFFLAGIYPVGMKIAADWYEKGLGKALGWLVGALVLGTAFPHLLRLRDLDIPWKSVLYCTSVFALLGGLLMIWLVGDGPYRKKTGVFHWNALSTIFASKQWRQAAFGYFGHMWELYTFWGFIPVIIALYAELNDVILNIPLLSFLIIGVGSIGCITGGYLSTKSGSAKVAAVALLISGACFFISPLIYQFPFIIFLTVLFLWGLAAPADSPQFSTLVANYAPPHLTGTALTIYNSIGFAIASLSLFVIDRLFYSSTFLAKENSLLLLGIGALIGLPGIFRLMKKKEK